MLVTVGVHNKRVQEARRMVKGKRSPSLWLLLLRIAAVVFASILILKWVK